MKGILNTKNGLTKIVDIQIPYRFIQTIIDDYDYKFVLNKKYDSECYYIEESREKIDYAGQSRSPDSGQ